MGVGDSREIPYTLRGALPAGPWKLRLSGFAAMPPQAVMHADVLVRPKAGGAETTVVSFDSPMPSDTVPIDDTKSGPAVSNQCGDTLVLKIKYVSGKGEFFEVGVNFSIP
jgi:hypothetical protein